MEEEVTSPRVDPVVLSLREEAQRLTAENAQLRETTHAATEMARISETELTRAKSQLAEAQHQVGLLQATVTQANARQEHTESELRRLRAGVIRIAQEAKREQGWCRDGVNEKLRSIGLELPPDRYQGQLIITVDFTAQMDEDADVPSNYDVQSEVNQADITRMLTGRIRVGGAAVTVGDVEYEVEDVGPVEE